jgi:protein-tyrosine-phosphatase
MTGDLPRSVLFVCTHNTVRSPIAAALMQLRYGPLVRVHSAGVRPGEVVDQMAVAVMDEAGVDLGGHGPKGLGWFEENEISAADVVVSLSPEAHHHALALGPSLGESFEYWATFDPTAAEGTREQVLNEYRLVRDGLDRRIGARFSRLTSD